MLWYEQKIFPLLNHYFSQKFTADKVELLADCSGEVLEIGFGTGLSLPCYGSQVTSLKGIEPHRGMLAHRPSPLKFPVEILQGRAEHIPLADHSFDCAVSIFTLCSVDDLTKSLKELTRILKPGGHFYFLEHMAQPPDQFTHQVQNFLQPLWGHLACGCHVNRNTLDTIMHTGFKMEFVKMIVKPMFLNPATPIIMGKATVTKPS